MMVILRRGISFINYYDENNYRNLKFYERRHIENRIKSKLFKSMKSEDNYDMQEI